MASFKFRLQSYLNLKEQLEKSIKNELGVALQEYQRQLSILSDIQNEIENQREEHRGEVMSKTTSTKLKLRLNYLKAMQTKEREQQARVNEHKRNVDKIRERLVEIMKEKKILEKLRDKQKEAFQIEQEKKQQLLIDELVSFRGATGDDRLVPVGDIQWQTKV